MLPNIEVKRAAQIKIGWRCDVEKLFKCNEMDTYKDMKTTDMKINALTSACDKRFYMYHIGFFSVVYDKKSSSIYL